MEIYAMRSDERHSFGVAFAQAESEEKAIELVQDRTGYETLNLEVIGTFEDYKEKIKEKNVKREIYRR